MKSFQKNKGLLSTLLLGVYIFVALFASNFHHHGSGLVFKDFHFKKTEHSIVQSDTEKEFVDCLSCHLFHDGKNLVPQIFSFRFLKKFIFQKQYFAFQQQFSTVRNEVLLLRGPPFLFRI